MGPVLPMSALYQCFTHTIYESFSAQIATVYDSLLFSHLTLNTVIDLDPVEQKDRRQFLFTMLTGQDPEQGQ